MPRPQSRFHITLKQHTPTKPPQPPGQVNQQRTILLQAIREGERAGGAPSLWVAARQAKSPDKKPSPDIEARAWRQGQDKYGTKKAFIV